MDPMPPPYVGIGPRPVRADVLPEPQPVDADVTGFFAVLGETMARWQLTEMFLFGIYKRAIEPHSDVDNDALSVAYHEVRTFGGRLSVVDAAVRERLRSHPDVFAIWRDLRGRLREASSQRNRWAHGVVFYDPTRASGDKLFLGPNVLDPRKNRERFSQDVTTTIAQLVEAQQTSENARTELAAFQQTLITTFAGSQV